MRTQLRIEIKSIAILLFSAIALATAWGCAPGSPAGASRQAPELTIAAAASLKPVLPELARAFKKATGREIKADFAASGLLARQIENGAPFDVYLSAGREYTRELRRRGRLKNARAYARGELVLIGKAASLADLKSAAVKRVAVANPSHAPYGRAAREALVKSGLWPAIKSKLVYGANVDQAYDYVKTNNADAGLVSLSLLRRAEGNYLLVDRRLYHPIEQWAGVVSDSRRQTAAREFIDFLSRPAAREILRNFGYKVVTGARR